MEESTRRDPPQDTTLSQPAASPVGTPLHPESDPLPANTSRFTNQGHAELPSHADRGVGESVHGPLGTSSDHAIKRTETQYDRSIAGPASEVSAGNEDARDSEVHPIARDLERLSRASAIFSQTPAPANQQSPANPPNSGTGRSTTPKAAGSAPASSIVNDSLLSRHQIDGRLETIISTHSGKLRPPKRVQSSVASTAKLTIPHEEVTQGPVDMENPITTQKTDSAHDEWNDHPGSDERRARLEVELRQARDELQQLRKKASYQTQMYGTIGTQGRRLDQRAIELRERVAQAQEALDERAAHFRLDLARDRERLKAYRDKLQQKAKELATSARRQKKKLAEQRIQLERQSIELEERENRFRDNELRIREAEARLEKEREELKGQRTQVQGLTEQIGTQQIDRQSQDEERAALQAKLDQAQQELDVQRNTLERRQCALEEKETALDARLADYDSLQAELATRSRKLEESECRFADIERRANEIEQREADLASRIVEVDHREEMLELGQSTFQHEKSEVDFQSGTLQAKQERLDEERSTLDKRAAILDEREAQAEETGRRLDTIASEQCRESERLAALKETYEQDIKQLTARQEVLARRQEKLDTETLELHTDQEKLRSEQETFEKDKAAFEEAEQALSADRVTLTEQEDLLKRGQDRLAETDVDLKDALARLERDRLALEDRSRTLDEQQSQIETDRSANDEARQKLEQQTEETRELRGRLIRKVDRYQQRKSRLAEDLEELEAQRKQVDSERSNLSRELTSLKCDRERVENQQTELSTEQDALKSEREELEQSRLTFEAGLRKLEEDQRDLSERETKLAERADQLEAYRQRLEEDYSELQSQREELLAIQDEHGHSSQQVTSLMQQAQSREQELKDREIALSTHEEALSARAAELARSESELQRAKTALDDQARQVEENQEELEAERGEIESLKLAELEEIAEHRRAFETEIANQRDQIQKRQCELDRLIAERREALETEQQQQEQALLDELRQRIEMELAGRIAEANRREEEVDRHCEARLADVQRDIDQRLERFEAEIKLHQEQAGRGMATLGEGLEEQCRPKLSPLDQQIEHLQQEQSPAGQEHDMVQSHLAEEGVDQLRSIEDRHSFDDVSDLTSSDRMALPECEEDDETVELTEGSTIDLSEGLEEATDESAWTEGTTTTAVSHRAVAKPHAVKMSSEAQPGRRFRPVRTTIWALLLGVMVAGAVLWSPSKEVQVRGRWIIKSPASQGAMTAREHAAVIIRTPEVFTLASKKAGVDLGQWYLDKKLEIAPAASGDAVEVTAHATLSNREKVQRCVNAVGESYETALAHSVISEDRRKQTLAEITSQYNDNVVELDHARLQLAEMRKALEQEESSGELASEREKQISLKQQSQKAKAEAEAAQKAYQEFKSTQSIPKGPIVPTAEQIDQAMAQDTKAMQAIDQRMRRSLDFDHVLLRAIAKSQTPLASLRSSIDAFADEVDQQRKKQSDPDIRAELELVAVDLSDYREHAEEFQRKWDQLTPQIAAWKEGDDPELLLDYQKKAELLVREFHAKSKSALSRAIQKADAIGRGGKEMTKRRIIQNVLAQQSHAGFEAWKTWIDAAITVVPANNAELEALRDAIVHLSPRIEERRDFHRAEMAKIVLKKRQDDWRTELQRLKNLADEADRRQRHLNQQAMTAMESVVAKDQDVLQTTRSRRETIDQQKQRVARLQQEQSQLEDTIQHLKSGGQISMAGAVHYRPSKPILPSRFNLTRRNPALLLGGITAVMFWIFVWMLVRPRRTPISKHGSTR